MAGMAHRASRPNVATSDPQLVADTFATLPIILAGKLWELRVEVPRRHRSQLRDAQKINTILRDLFSLIFAFFMRVSPMDPYPPLAARPFHYFFSLACISNHDLAGHDASTHRYYYHRR